MIFVPLFTEDLSWDMSLNRLRWVIENTAIIYKSKGCVYRSVLFEVQDILTGREGYIDAKLHSPRRIRYISTYSHQLQVSSEPYSNLNGAQAVVFKADYENFEWSCNIIP